MEESWNFKNHHGELKNTLAELLLGCGNVLLPKFAQFFDTQSAKIWPLVKILEVTCLWNRYVSAQNGHGHNNSNKTS